MLPRSFGTWANWVCFSRLPQPDQARFGFRFSYFVLLRSFGTWANWLCFAFRISCFVFPGFDPNPGQLALFDIFANHESLSINSSSRLFSPPSSPLINKYKPYTHIRWILYKIRPANQAKLRKATPDSLESLEAVSPPISWAFFLINGDFLGTFIKASLSDFERIDHD